jgi:hypothetical protein
LRTSKHVGIVAHMLAQDDEEYLAPEALRPRFRKLASALVAGDFELLRHELVGISPIDASPAQVIAEQIAAYGDDLAPLSEEVWRQSAYRWMSAMFGRQERRGR